MDKLLPLKLPPGMRNTGTVYQSKDRWNTGNLVRFFNDTIQPIGGWTKRTLTNGTAAHAAGFFVAGRSYTISSIGGSPTNFMAIGASANTIGITFTATGVGSGDGTATPQYAGTVSAAHSWSDASGIAWIAVGTTMGLFVVKDSTNVVYDITPYAFLPSSSVVWSLDNFGGWLVATPGNKTPGTVASNQLPFVWKASSSIPASQCDSVYTSAYTPTSDCFTNIAALVATPERFLMVLNGTPMNATIGSAVPVLYANG